MTKRNRLRDNLVRLCEAGINTFKKRRDTEVSVKKAIRWTLIWMGLAILFNIGVYFVHYYGLSLFNIPADPAMAKKMGLEFLGGYIIEFSLSIDNLFVFLVIFSSFCLSIHHQRRVLNWGIAGAIVLRLVFIVLGIKLVNMFDWLLQVFGLILIFSGGKMLFGNDKPKDMKNSKMLKILRKVMPVSDELHGDKFFFRKNKLLYATPLLAILVIVEGSDIIFAIDSIPAIFSISTHPFIVFSSNIFAILGLRSLYFVLHKLHSKFWLVKYGVGFILIFTGLKLALLFFHWHIPTQWSILVIFGILVCSILASVIFKEKSTEKC